jgi:hypothetical protein
MRLSRLAPLLSLPALAACGTSWDAEYQARERAEAALECREVTLVKLSDVRFRASGCGGVLEVLCSSGHNEPVCLVGRAREEGRVSGLSEAGSGGESTLDAEHEPPSGPDADDEAPPTHAAEIEVIEARIRAGLDAHRDDVLACTGRSASVVRARYALDGSITLTLAGDLEGSPEEGCVRAAIGGVRVGAGHEGTVMHLVRRPSGTAPPAPPPPAAAPPSTTPTTQ